ncbi:hypothetical protein DMUE_1562 [Dictyocoela muelleri]|nr:hypothetical protein DMUE_1562 [Dictyocoela muelleri]
MMVKFKYFFALRMDLKNEENSFEETKLSDECSKKISTKRWSYAAVELLISLRTNISNKMAIKRAGKSSKNKVLWEEIASEMGDIMMEQWLKTIIIILCKFFE